MEIATACSRCGSRDVLPMVYGMPGPELTEESIHDKVALGGCVVFPDAPDLLCQNCGADWRAAEVVS
jgi:hypothetical protein